VLEVPQEFRYGSSAGQTRAWSLNILTFYPSLTSQRDPANASYGLYCVGFCNGRILISIEYWPSVPTHHRGQSAGDAGAHGILRHNHEESSTNVHVVDLKSEFGFDQAFEKTTDTPPGGKSTTPANSSRIDRYLLKLAPHRVHYDAYAHCSMSTPIHGCEIYSSLTCNPAVRISVNGWLLERMSEASEIQNRVAQFVAAMVKEPECKQ